MSEAQDSCPIVKSETEAATLEPSVCSTLSGDTSGSDVKVNEESVPVGDVQEAKQEARQETRQEEKQEAESEAKQEANQEAKQEVAKDDAEPGQSESTVIPTPQPETPEVSSTKNDEPAPKPSRSSSSSGRRPSYNSSRGYAGGYQNYGLTYLPYKSNFEPSEDARRKADEFFKTLKL